MDSPALFGEEKERGGNEGKIIKLEIIEESQKKIGIIEKRKDKRMSIFGNHMGNFFFFQMNFYAPN